MHVSINIILHNPDNPAKPITERAAFVFYTWEGFFQAVARVRFHFDTIAARYGWSPSSFPHATLIVAYMSHGRSEWGINRASPLQIQAHYEAK